MKPVDKIILGLLIISGFSGLMWAIVEHTQLVLFSLGMILIATFWGFLILHAFLLVPFIFVIILGENLCQAIELGRLKDISAFLYYLCWGIIQFVIITNVYVGWPNLAAYLSGIPVSDFLF